MMRSLLSSLLVVVVGFSAWLLTSPVQNKGSLTEWANQARLSPWEAVGGCGAGGSGGGAGDGIQWVGQGVSGGLVNVEVLPKFAAGQNFSSLTVPLRMSFKPIWNMEVGASMPWMSKTSEVQYRSNQVPDNRSTGGTGDLSMDVTLSVGPSGQYGVTLGQSFPTGQYDIIRGPDAAQEYLPASLQKGSGLYNSSLGIAYSRDVDEGIWIYNVTYSHPWNTRVMTGQNEFMDSQLKNYRGSQSKRFYYDWKGYGETDLGDYVPPSLSLGVHYGYRGVPGMVHSFGFTFGAPLGVAWIRNEQVGLYDPRPDPDHKAWSAALVYGAEFSQDDFPIFMAFSLPFHDKANAPNANEYDPKPMSKWDGPDTKDLFQQWIVALGFKTSFL